MLKMEINGGASVSTPTTVAEANTPATSPSPASSPPPPLSPSQPPVVLSPCAACKILRRRCAEKCVLAPYFPPTDPAKFTIAHRVFGASNIIKFLQELPESQRTDAVNSMVYEAGARLRDPVYGCAGAIYHLQRQVSELQAQLAKTQVELVSMQLQRSDLLELLYKMDQTKLQQAQGQDQLQNNNKMSNFESSFESGGDEFISSPDDEETNDLGFLEDKNMNNDSSMSWWDRILFGHDDHKLWYN